MSNASNGALSSPAAKVHIYMLSANATAGALQSKKSTELERSCALRKHALTCFQHLTAARRARNGHHVSKDTANVHSFKLGSCTAKCQGSHS